MASEWELGRVTDNEGNDVVLHREYDGTVVFWEPENGHTLTFLPAERDKLRELLDRAAMPGQATDG